MLASYRTPGRSNCALSTLVGIDADARVLQPARALEHEAGAGEEYERERDLGADEERPGAETAEAPRALELPPATLSTASGRSSRRVEGRQDRHQDGRDERQAHRERQRQRIEANHPRANAGQTGGAGNALRAGADGRAEKHVESGRSVAAAASSTAGDDQSAEGSGAGEQHALDHELARDARASGAERHPDGDFATAGDRFGDEKIREVHARDQQHESHGAEDDERDTAQVGVHARVIQRPGRGACGYRP